MLFIYILNKHHQVSSYLPPHRLRPFRFRLKWLPRKAKRKEGRKKKTKMRKHLVQQQVEKNLVSGMEGEGTRTPSAPSATSRPDFAAHCIVCSTPRLFIFQRKVLVRLLYQMQTSHLLQIALLLFISVVFLQWFLVQISK